MCHVGFCRLDKLTSSKHHPNPHSPIGEGQRYARKMKKLRYIGNTSQFLERFSDLDKIRRVYHNNERILNLDEVLLLRTHGLGERSNYRLPGKQTIQTLPQQEPFITWQQWKRWMQQSSQPWQQQPITAAKKVNRSGLTKEQVLNRASGKDKDAISKMTETEFQNTVLKPTGEIAEYKPGITVDQMTYDPSQRSMVLKDQTLMSSDDYTKTFNENLDVLNNIIAQKNKSGVNYRVKELTPDGRLVFETPSGQNVPEGTTSWGVRINPGKWKGNVEDVANTAYYLCSPENTGVTGQFIKVDLGYSDVRVI